MKDRDDHFKPTVRPPRSTRAGNQRFVHRVLREAGGSLGSRPRQAGRGARLGRGHVAATLAGRGLNSSARRVVIKTRLVRLDAGGKRSAARHLQYIERDGAGRDGEAGRAFGPQSDTVDLDDFREAGVEDRHQFRLIVAPEDGDQLGDLRTYTRALMRRMERDLGTELEWAAVEHWDTDNPHVHIVLRGRDDQGCDLVIARDYIARGMRERANELATEWLGPRTKHEIAESLHREIEQPRWTRLDRALQDHLHQGTVRLDDDLATETRLLLRGRLQHLISMDLARPLERNAWSLHPDFESTLRTMGERGDIIRTMERAMAGKGRELAIFDPTRETPPVVGRVAAAGLADELSERGYLIVDGLDGRAHYVGLPAGADIAEFTRGGIVEIRPFGTRAIDEAITGLANGGVFRGEEVIASLRTQGAPDPEGTLQAQTRRLEALRRTRLVERLPDGSWQIPNDLAARGQAYDRRRMDGARTVLHTPIALQQQSRAIGATWLDQQLVTRQLPEGETGFAPEVRDALKERTEFLIEQGLAERRGRRVVLARDLLTTLRQRELQSFAEQEAAVTGKLYQPAVDGQRVTGTYRRSVQLVSGRMAMLDTGSGFSLVPWRAVIDKQLGRSISATVTGSRVSFEWNRGHEHLR
jgi:type IV secretory pathway VirD2 relaxase